MPRLLAFLPCDNILLSGAEQSASLIVIMTQIGFPSPLPDNLPPNAAVPLRWYLFSQWEMAESETTTEFEQRVHMDAKDGSRLLESFTKFMGQPGKPIHRITVLSQGFPIVEAGIHRLILSLRRPPEGEWEQVAEYPLTVTYGPRPAILDGRQ